VADPDPTYLVRQLPQVPVGVEIYADPTPVDGAVAAFGRLRERGDYITAWDGGKIPAHRYTGDNYGAGRAVIHVQGVQRLRDGRHILVSGGDKLQSVSHLFVIRVGSAVGDRAFGSNVRDARDPPPGDTIVNMIGLRSSHWHAGGIALLGDVVAVPLEAGGEEGDDGQVPKARVVFLDLADPLNPRALPQSSEIVCETEHAGAVALTRLPNGYFLCAVWRDVRKSGRLDFFLSAHSGPFAGFGQNPPWTCQAWTYGGSGGTTIHYQSIGFLWDAGAPGSLYLVGTRNTSAGAPSIPGTDYADLFAVELSEQMLRPQPVMRAGGFPAPTIEKVGEAKRFSAADEHCNLAAGGGVYVSPSGILAVYGAFHWRISETFRLSEFRSESLALPTDAHAWVDLFEDEEFRGRRLSVIGRGEASISDYGKISVQGRSFDDTVSSVRFQLPRGWTYRLYKYKGYELSGNNRDYIDLQGTGAVEEIAAFRNEKKTFGDSVSSSRYL
jgi:hypothetical protein